MPSFDTEFYRALIRTHCEAEGIQFIDTEPILQEMFDAGQTMNFRGDAHFNGPTSLQLGEYLYQSLVPGRQTAQQ